MTEKDIGETIDGLAALPRGELLDLFRSVYGCPPPRNIHRRLLRQAVAYQLQVKFYGKEKEVAALKRRLDKLAAELRRTGKISVPAPSPATKAGTRLLRDWQGNTHSVMVTAQGYEYRGTTYRSLSQIARLITGTRWSGPAFFGLREKKHG